MITPRRYRLGLLIAVLASNGCTPRGSAVRAGDQFVAAESLYLRGSYDSASAIWQAQLDHARSTGDLEVEARAVTWFGILAWKRGDLREGRRLGEQALELKREHRLERELWRSYNALGLVAWYEGRLRDAADLYERAEAAARQVRERRGLGASAGNLGLVHTELGDFAEARRGFLTAIEIGREVRDPRVEGNASSNLGMLAIRTGSPEEALPHLHRARELFRSIGNATGEQHVLGQLGTAYAALGEPQLAIAALDSGLVEARRHGLRAEEAANLEQLAAVYREGGDLHRALRVLVEAKAINSELGLTLEVGADLRTEAEIHATLGDLGLAVRHAEEALRTHRAIGARFEALADLLLLAEIAGEAGRWREATVRLANARALAREIGVRRGRVWVALASARLADRRGDPRAVLATLSDAQEDLDVGGYRTEWETEALRARAYARLGHLEDAVAAGRRAVEAVDRVRGSYESGLLQTTVVSDKSTVFADLARVLIRLGRPDEAFEVSDAARGRPLTERVPSAIQVTTSDAADPRASGDEILCRIGVLQAGIDEREAALATGDDPGLRAELDILYELVSRARTQYEDFTVRVGGDVVTRGRESTARVQAVLARGEVLLEYLVTADGVLLFVVTPARVSVLESPISLDNLASRVRLAREILGRTAAPAGPPSPVLGSLYDVLIRPARQAGLLGKADHLLIVPHGVLAYLPFAALRDDSTARYLMQDFGITHLPTAAMLPVLRARRAGTVAARDVSVFAPFPDQLPASRREADAIRRAGHETDVRIGRRATERALRDALARGGPAHVASHGVLNARSPLFSRIMLASGDPGRASDDGRFELHELLSLSTRSPLVFLSGCETGLGSAWATRYSPGEDYLTLGQAFLRAGVWNVVATLWRVEDEGAAEFAERFYGRLRSGTPAEALVGAQRDMMAHPRYAAPYYWAAYQVLGASGQSPPPRKNMTLRP